MEEPIISVKNVVKKYKTFEHSDSKRFPASLFRKKIMKTAVKGVSFSIRRGEIVALLGRNGSGKSTIIKMLTGILYPNKGNISVMGLNPWDDRAKLAYNIGVVLGAHGQLYWNLPAIDTFEFIKSVYRIDDGEYDKRLKRLIEMLSLEKVYKKPVRTMSLGEQMKCNFVASILHSPKLIFLDEPTIGVDLPSKNALKEAVLDTRERYNSTFLLTTHIVEDIEIADRVLIMDKGKKVFDGSRKKLNGMFGNYRRVELAFGNGKIPELKSYGRIISSKGGVVRMEVSVRALKEKRFINLLASRNVLDYRVSEAGLSHVLSKLYGKLEGKRQVGEDE